MSTGRSTFDNHLSLSVYLSLQPSQCKMVNLWLLWKCTCHWLSLMPVSFRILCALHMYTALKLRKAFWFPLQLSPPFTTWNFKVNLTFHIRTVCFVSICAAPSNATSAEAWKSRWVELVCLVDSVALWPVCFVTGGAGMKVIRMEQAKDARSSYEQ